MLELFKRIKEKINNLEKRNENEIKVTSDQSISQIKKPVNYFRFTVKGTHIDEKQKVISNLVKKLKKQSHFIDTYEGLSNRDIIEDYYDERIYEIDREESLPRVDLIKDDDNPYDENAIKVIVRDIEGYKYHVGYVPKEKCVTIRGLMDEYKMVAEAFLEGGKYKEVDYDEFGDEQVKIHSREYWVKVEVAFWNN